MIRRKSAHWLVCSLKKMVMVTLGIFILSTPAAAEIHLWPLIETTPASSTIAYPFYVDEGDFKMIFPFYYKTNRGKDHHFLWPFVKVSEGRLTRFAPFWFSGNKETYTIFPLIRKTPESTLWFVPPVYFDEAGDFSAVIPAYIKKGGAMFVFPNIYFAKNDDHIRCLTVFPFYYRSRAGDGDVLWALPYYSSRTHAGSATTALYPFYEKAESTNSRSLWILPYYHSTSAEQSTVAVFPFFGMAKNASRAESAEHLWVMWPVYDKEEHYSPNGELVSRSRRFLFFSDDWHKNGKRVMKIFGVPVRETVARAM